MGFSLRKRCFSFLRFLLQPLWIGLFFVGCSNGAMGPMGGPNAAAPGMSTGVSAPSADYGGKKVALVLEGEVEKNPTSQDPNQKPYHTHMKGSLGCNIVVQEKLCYGGRVFRMVDPTHERYLDILTNSEDGKATFDITFDSDLPNLDDYQFYYTPQDYSPSIEDPLTLALCPGQVCADPDWSSMHVFVQSEVVPRMKSSSTTSNPVQSTSQTNR